MTLSVAPVTGETNVENNFKTVSVTIVTEIIHDAAVMAITPTAADGITPIGTADVINGTIISVNVRTINTGTVTDTFVLALADVTDNITIAELSVTLFPGEGVTFGLPWDTSGVSSGDHTLTATATLSGDADTTNNSLSTEVPVRVVTIAIFVEGADAVFPVDSNGSPAPLILQAPNITTVVQPITSFLFASADGILTRTTGPVEIVTVAQPLTSLFLTNADAITDRAFELVEIATVAQPFTEFFLSEADATTSTVLTAFSNPTSKESLSELFIGNADAVLDVGRLRNPLTGFATVRSERVQLQGRGDSTGAFLRVAGRLHFVEADGSFEFSVAPGTYDILITAPGYIYVVLPDIELKAGHVLSVPELTLPFGDADGNGKIDVNDLVFLGANFGAQWREITP